ncbi:hypothetical protein TVNIR_1687 [Thioalkalivibrio nitratireducens DSM 14787]|uniref:Uncharacterized protein n=1 Tax=Thioalkalivibrio nitratireducens (strain DSM 14787 / UNIQEM 213 / ALEN2) TaxID=1255043 RepID=L0DYA6_THIND|nr:hypothetical protein TVNIR_1687 [Thioalkalivibrio nitratireducens DSM 14787]
MKHCKNINLISPDMVDNPEWIREHFPYLLQVVFWHATP